MDLLKLEDYEQKRVDEEDQNFKIYANLADEACLCPQCNEKMVRFGKRERVVKDLPRLGKRCSIHVKTRRWRCNHCLRTFYDKLLHVDEKHRMTERLVQWIGEQAVRRTYSSIAKEVGVTERTISFVFSEYVEAKYSKMNFATPRWLGIDEIYLIKPRCIITNVEKLTAFEILSDREKTTVADRLKHLTDRSSVELVTINMWRPYRDAAREIFPEATLVVDKFHVVRLLNAASETVRNEMRSRLTKHQRRGLVNDRFLMLKRKESLTEQEQMMLFGWIKKYPELAMAYEVKEAGYRIYDAKTPEQAQNAFVEWRENMPQEMKDAFGDFERAWNKWQVEILKYFDFRVTNAYSESLNNLIRSTNRIGRGYSFEALKAKVFLSEGQEKAKKVRPQFQRIMSRDLEIKRHDMSLPERPAKHFGTPLSTLKKILGDEEIGVDQS